MGMKRIVAVVFIFLCYTVEVLWAQAPQVTVVRPQLVAKKGTFPGLSTRKAQRPRIALVLSGGGARGLSAIGVLKVLEREHIPIDIIIGTSMGSVIGGLYASGYSIEQLKAIADTARWEEILSLSDESRREEMFLDQKIARDRSVLVLRFEGFEPVIPSAFSTGQRLTRYLNRLTLNALYHPVSSFDDLKIPFRAVATDLVSGKRVVMDRGDLTTAIRASIAIPLVFTSVKKDTLQLLDGGLVANLPVDVARQEGADIIIAVEMMSTLRSREQLSTPWEIVDQITTIMMQQANEVSRSKADVIITPKLGNWLSNDFSNADTLLQLGEKAAEEALPRLWEVIQKRWQGEETNDTIVYINPQFILDSGDVFFKGMCQHIERRKRITEGELRNLLSFSAEEGNCDSLVAEVQKYPDSTLIRILHPLKPIVRDVYVSGITITSPDSVQKYFAGVVGYPWNERKVVRALESFLSFYRTNGYSLARIQEVHFDSTAGTLSVSVNEGVINRIDVHGAVKTRHWVLRREMPIKAGDIFTIQNAEQGIANLYATSLFEQVVLAVRMEPTEPERTILVLDVRERSTGLVRMGVRLDDERGFQPSVDVRDENFLGTATEIGFSLSGGDRNQKYSAEIKATRIFDTYFTLALRGYQAIRDVNVYNYDGTIKPDYFRRNRVGEYRERRRGGMVSFGTQLERMGNLLIAGRIEKVSVSTIFEAPITNETYTLSAVRFGTELDTQDKYPYPTDGILMNLYYETATVQLGSSVGYTKFFFLYEKYQTILPNLTVRPKIVLGVGDDAVPVSEQFSLGGQQTFFGLRENDSRGRQLIIGSLECQYKLPLMLYFDTYLKIRYDLGGIWSRVREVRPADFTHGFGGTLAIDTPIGPAEFSVSRAFFLRMDVFQHPASWGPLLFSFSIGYPLVNLWD